MSEKKRFRRWRYVIDWKAQLGTAMQVIAVLSAVCLVCAVGVNFVKSDAALDEMTPDEIRNFLFKTTSVQFLISAVTLALLAIYLTHRFAGPAFVLDRAVRETLRGDYSREVHLRERDYLKPLAASVEKLRERVHEREQLLVELAGKLEAGDVDAARALLKQGHDPEEREQQNAIQEAAREAAAV